MLFRSEVSGEPTASITFDDITKRTAFSTQQQVWTENGITFTHDKGTSLTNIQDYRNPIRIYKGSSVTINFNRKISQIKIACNSLYNSQDYAQNLLNSIDPAVASVTIDGVEVTIKLKTPADSFTFTATAGQVRIQQLYVWATVSLDTSTEEPDFDLDVNFDDLRP